MNAFFIDFIQLSRESLSMKYRLTDFPATLLAVAIGIYCAMFGGDTLSSVMGTSDSLLFPPTLALLVVIVSTIAIQIYVKPKALFNHPGFLKAYFVRSIGIAVTVGVVGFVGGFVERIPVVLDQHVPCSGLERC